MPGEVRRDRVLTLVEEHGFVRVTDLSDMFEVSEVTVRSDLDQLARSSLIDRVHGGAMTRSRVSTAGSSPEEAEPSFEESADTMAHAKSAIGRAAASLVKSGDSIIVDVGTTTTAVARALRERTDLEDVIVFTNSLTIAMELECAIPQFTVILTGGRLRPRQHSLVNPMGNGILDQINVTTAFIGCNGIHPIDGVTNINLPEAQIKTRMVGAAHQVVVVADGTKVGKVSVARVAHINNVHRLITTESAPSDVLDQIQDLGVNTTVAT